MSDFFKWCAGYQEQSVVAANKARGKRKPSNSWLDRNVGEDAPQDKGVAAATRPPVVIPSMANRNKASTAVEGKCRAVVHGYFKNDPFGAAHAPLGAHGIQEHRADAFSPVARQYAKRQDLAFLAEVESQSKPCQRLVYPSELPEESRDAHYLGDRPGAPRVVREAGAVQYRHRAGHDFGQPLETA